MGAPASIKPVNQRDTFMNYSYFLIVIAWSCPNEPRHFVILFSCPQLFILFIYYYCTLSNFLKFWTCQRAAGNTNRTLCSSFTVLLQTPSRNLPICFTCGMLTESMSACRHTYKADSPSSPQSSPLISSPLCLPPLFFISPSVETFPSFLPSSPSSPSSPAFLP